MAKKNRFRRRFDKQHGKRAQALLKSTPQHIYHIEGSLHNQLSRKNLLLVIWKIFGLLVHTLAADEKYLILNRDNLAILILLQLS